MVYDGRLYTVFMSTVYSYTYHNVGDDDDDDDDDDDMQSWLRR